MSAHSTRADRIADILTDNHTCKSDVLIRDHDRHPKPRRGRCAICDGINNVAIMLAGMSSPDARTIHSIVGWMVRAGLHPQAINEIMGVRHGR